MQNAAGTSLASRWIWRFAAGALPFLALWGLYELQTLFGVLRYITPLSRYVFIAVAAIIAYHALRARGSDKNTFVRASDEQAASIVATSSIFALCLLVLLISWSNGGTQDVSAIGGVVPYSDAAGYFEGAERLVYDRQLTQWTERRPLNAAFLAARLILSGNHFFGALVIQAILAAVALSIATSAIYQTHGRTAALWFFAFSFSFVSCSLHRTLSEPLGISLGLIAFALLWSAIANRSLTHYGLGIFVLSLALLARAGAMFALPASALFALYLFPENWRTRLVAAFTALAAIACAWLVNSTIIHLYGSADGTLLSNFSYVIYGLAQGGTSWTQGLKDFPQLVNATDADISRFLYQKAIETILTKPYLLLWGLAKSFGMGIVMFPAHILRLIADGSDGGSLWRPAHVVIAGVVAIPLFGLSLLRFEQSRDKLDRFQIFLLVQLLAGAASLPFFYQDGGIRLTAATFPFMAATIAVILSAAFSLSPAGEVTKVSKTVGTVSTAVIAMVVLMSLIAPKVDWKTRQATNTTAIQCRAGEEEIKVEIGDGSAHINIVSNDKAAAFAPNIREADFTVSAYNEARQELLSLAAPVTILLAFDRKSKALVQLVGPLGFADGPAKQVSLCAEPLRGKTLTHRIAPQ